MANNSSVAKKQVKNSSSDYSKIVQTQKFQELLRKKRNFIVPMSSFFLVFYFTLPVLTSFTDILNNPAIGSISWAWVFASAQFIMTWTLCMIYSNRAAKFDKITNEILEDAKSSEKGENG